MSDEKVTPRRFRKKPVEIEAFRYDGRFPLDFLGFDATVNQVPGESAIQINTLEGVMRAELGDWIIKGIKGEFYPVKDPIFRETYEEVEGMDMSGVLEGSRLGQGES